MIIACDVLCLVGTIVTSYIISHCCIQGYLGEETITDSSA